MVEGRGEVRIKVWLGLAATSLMLLVQQGTVANSDGRSAYEVSRSLVERRSVTVPPDAGILGRNGDHYSRYGIGLSVLAAVPYAAALPVAELTSRKDRVEELAVSLLVPLSAGLLVVVLYMLARRLGAGTRRSLGTAVGAVLGTFLFPYTKDFYSEPVAALFITLSLERALARRPGQAAAALAAAGLVRPQAFVLAPLLLWGLWREGGRAALPRAALALAAGVAIAVGYNVARFADPLDFGYSDVGFTADVLEGTGGLLFDPAKSVFLFAPAAACLPLAFAALARRHSTAALLIGGNLLLTFAIAASWKSWEGGWAWGPRLMLVGVIPTLPILAPWMESSRVRTLVVTGLFAIGFAVSAAALIVPIQAQQLDRPLPDAGPGIARQYELIPRTARYTRAHLYEPDQGRLGEHRRYLSLWQVGAARELGRKGLLLAVAASLALVALLAWATLKLARALCLVRPSGEPVAA